MDRKNKKKGISLFELMITASVATTLALVGFISFSESIKTQTVRNSAGKLAYAIKEAKYKARAKGLVTELTAHVNSDRFVFRIDGQDVTNETDFDALSGTLPEKIRIVSTTCGDLYFNADGTLTDSEGNVIYTNCSITVGYDNGPSETVSIKGKTGNVEYE